MTGLTPPPRPGTGRGTGAMVAGIAVAVALDVCCAGPALLPSGLLGGIGVVLVDPWVIAAAVLLAGGAVAWRVGRPRGCHPKLRPQRPRDGR
jgi:mercuric ion transport protein